MEVLNDMYGKYNERGTKAFEKRVKNFLSIEFQDQSISAKEVICQNAWMERGGSRGSYYRCLSISIDGETYYLSSHTNDSEAWDYFEATNKNKRQLFEAVLSMEIKSLIEQL